MKQVMSFPITFSCHYTWFKFKVRKAQEHTHTQAHTQAHIALCKLRYLMKIWKVVK